MALHVGRGGDGEDGAGHAGLAGAFHKRRLPTLGPAGQTTRRNAAERQPLQTPFDQLAGAQSSDGVVIAGEVGDAPIAIAPAVLELRCRRSEFSACGWPLPPCGWDSRAMIPSEAICPELVEFSSGSYFRVGQDSRTDPARRGNSNSPAGARRSPLPGRLCADGDSSCRATGRLVDCRALTVPLGLRGVQGACLLKSLAVSATLTDSFTPSNIVLPGSIFIRIHRDLQEAAFYLITTTF